MDEVVDQVLIVKAFCEIVPIQELAQQLSDQITYLRVFILKQP